MKYVPCFRGLMTLIFSALSLPMSAQNISATVNAIDHSSYAGIASQFQLTNLKVDGQTIYNGSGYLFCTDYESQSLDEDRGSYPRQATNLTLGTMEQMDIWGSYTTSQNEPLARSMAHWFIDNYYETSFLAPVNNADARQYAFQNVIWEIFTDGATSSGLDFSNGNFDHTKFSPSSRYYDATLWGYMTDMLTAVNNSGVTTSYQNEYEVLVALDSRSGYQDYLMLSADPGLMVIPEPSSALLGLTAGAVFLLRRKRI